MSVADLLVIAIIAVLFGFIVWANVHHRKKGVGRRDPQEVQGDRVRNCTHQG